MKARSLAFVSFALIFQIPSRSDQADSQEQAYRSIHALEAEAHRDWVVHPVMGPTQPVQLSAGTPSNLTRTVFGFYPYWAPGYSQIRFQDLTHLAYFSVEANGSGQLVNFRGWPNVPLIQTAHQANVRVVLVCTLFVSSQLQSLLSSQAARQTLISNLREQVLSGGADGVNIDFEGVPGSQRLNLVVFMQELASAIRSAVPGAHISIDTPAVDWSNAWDHAALADICDALMIMGYDYYWSGSSYAGPVSPLASSELWGKYSVGWTIEDYLMKVGTGRSNKLLLGVPYYGYDWPVESDALKTRTLDKATARIYTVASSNAATYGRRWDNLSSTPWYFYTAPTPRQVWFEDEVSLSLKYDLVLQNSLQGVGIWALTYDRDRTELWKLIEDRFASRVAPDPPEITAPATFFDTVGLPVALKEKGTVPISGFEVAVGTSPGGKEVSDFKPVGLRRQVLIQGLMLAPGDTYYVTPRSLSAEGIAGLPGTSVPILMDTSQAPSRKFLPYWVSDSDVYTGLGMVNRTGTTRAVLIRGRVAGQQEPILTSWVLTPGEQIAKVISERDLLGPEVVGKEGWAEVFYQDSLHAMYLIGDNLVSRTLAGSPLVDAVAKQVVPELDGGRAWITAANPENTEAHLEFEYLGRDGTTLARSLYLPTGGLLRSRVSDLFPEAAGLAEGAASEPGTAVRSSFIILESDQPVVCTSTLERDQDSASIPALDTAGALKSGAWSYLITGGGYRTEIVLVNPTAESQTVQCRFFASGLNATVLLELSPLSGISAEAASLFGLGRDDAMSSWIRGAVLVTVTEGSGVVGSVWIRTQDYRIMAALPLEAPSSSPFVFPHLAQAQGCWTGISLANPGVSPCDVTVEAMNSRGILLGTYAVRLEPGENNAGLINQWIGSTTGLSSGRVEVRFTGPLLAAEIFGSDTLSFIASVPGR